MCRDTVGGRSDHLTNHFYKLVTKKGVIENTVANPLATWVTFDHLSCKFENSGGRGEVVASVHLSTVRGAGQILAILVRTCSVNHPIVAPLLFEGIPLILVS